MSQQSTVFRVSQKLLNCSDSGLSVGSDNNLAGRCFTAGGIKRGKIIINGLFVGLALTAWQVNAEGVKVDAYPSVSPTSSPEPSDLFLKERLDRVGNSIEFIKPVPGERSLIAIPQPKAKGNQGPDEHNQGRIGVEQNNKLTPDDTHKFWQLLLIQLSAFAVVFPAGAYLSMRANIRRDWRQHIPKGRLPEVPVMAMLSMFCIPRKIKPFRWRLWEQRSWFLDMKIRHGFEAAYRDAWFWKKLVAERC
ncbi:hypothetical protein ABN154_28905 [Klebsiella michiganensis]|uniref:hypothetical protein n=1 Tax=Klebsiella michiganensis TaxID=1134687 RepID=UPI0032DB4FBE